jgi:glycosyltransferase involved in cell wall biosynthesis
MIKISIIVPVYNAEKYLDTCLSNLISQTLEDIQIILVNDASTDNSEQIIAKYKEKCSHKITYIKKANGGAGDARNIGIQHATGTYIGFADADDYVETTMYEKMYNMAQEKNADWVECAYFHEYSDKPDTLQIKSIAYETSDTLVKTKFAVWNKIIKREIIQNNNIQFPINLNYEDTEFICKVVPYIHDTRLVQEPLYHYIKRSNSRYRQWNQTRDIFKIYENVLSFYKERGFYTQYKEQLEYIYIGSRLGASFFRILRIQDRRLSVQILEENWQDLVGHFPCWKKNKLLLCNKSLKGIYYKTINYSTYKMYAKIFRLLMAVHLG